ncbi:MAG: amino acid permease [Halobacteriaceae archaeon]
MSSSSGEEELAKDLGPLAALTIGVGTMIGAGIFVLPGEAAAAAGPAVALSFVVGGVVALFTALSASELGTAMPKAGGSYYYVNHALGPLFGSIAGWGNWIGLAFASAFYTLGFGEYVASFLPVPALGVGGVGLTGHQVSALLAGVAFVAVNYVGAKETGRLQNAIVVTLVAILTVFSVLGLLHADLSTLRPLFPAETGGAAAVLPATALVFVSFLGFAQITTVAEEIENPGRNLPLAVIGSVVIVTTMYAVIMVVLMGVVNWDVLGQSATPVLDVAEVAFGTFGLAAVGVGLLTFAGLLATASSANASILASSRINFAMGRDELVSSWLNDIHDRFQTPYRSIAITGGIIVAFVLVGDVTTLAKAGSVLHLVVYGLLNVSLLVMREARVPEYDPSFRVPLYPVTPVLGALTSFGLIAFMELVEVALAALFVVGGAAWYVLYARRHTEKSGVLGKQFDLERPSAGGIAASSTPDGGQFRVMVPLANPEHEAELVSVGSALAKRHGGRVVAVHVVEVPDQTALGDAAAHPEEFDPGSEALLRTAREDAERFGVPVETRTVFSHRSFEEIFDAAESLDASLVVMGWGENSHGSPGRAESAVDDLAHDLPCDFLVFRDRGFDPSRLLVPTAGGPDSDLGGSVAAGLAAEYDSETTVLHVVEERGEVEAAERFLAEWCADRGLEDAETRVLVGDVEAEIERAAEEATLLVLGASERGLLERLVRGTLVIDVVDDVDCSVLLAERARHRSLRERLFG